MKSGEFGLIESQRQALLGQLNTAQAALRAGLRAQGFGNTAREHLERALSHVQEAYVAINEMKSVRTVAQLVEDLNRIQQVMDEAKKSQRV